LLPQESDASFESLSPSEKAYNAWLEQWGNVDFSNLKYLPKVKTKSQLEAMQLLQALEAKRLLRTKAIYLGKPLKQIEEERENPQDPNPLLKRRGVMVGK